MPATRRCPPPYQSPVSTPTPHRFVPPATRQCWRPTGTRSGREACHSRHTSNSGKKEVEPVEPCRFSHSDLHGPKRASWNSWEKGKVKMDNMERENLETSWNQVQTNSIPPSAGARVCDRVHFEISALDRVKGHGSAAVPEEFLANAGHLEG